MYPAGAKGMDGACVRVCTQSVLVAKGALRMVLVALDRFIAVHQLVRLATRVLFSLGADTDRHRVRGWCLAAFARCAWVLVCWEVGLQRIMQAFRVE